VHHQQCRDNRDEQQRDNLQHQALQPVHRVVDEADGYLFCITDNSLVLLRDRLAKIIDRRLAFNGQVLEDREPFALSEPDRVGEVRRDRSDGGPPPGSP